LKAVTSYSASTCPHCWCMSSESRTLYWFRRIHRRNRRLKRIQAFYSALCGPPTPQPAYSHIHSMIAAAWNAQYWQRKHSMDV
jgi:hypothetical protein